ncbi:methylated-DNA--[protein]-cysteine S-methyltransferase [Peptostreptococcus faecalis]|uniref:methylated-DNA--[protein]-cysteine S-methyltransferase n=1 Tax=Peptostreptococcus faecalis TaxID=2045015 RepID=UPI000C7AE6F9|nr:methylated-DNA--[protein]-cysteine S-methyltransferase [Peptostreptococcus faecalis]
MNEKLMQMLEEMTKKSKLDESMMQQINEYLSGKRKKFDIDYAIFNEMSEFKKKVLMACFEIEYGQTKTYAQIAEEIGNPKGYRAVGNALNKNEYPIIIPCHRVVGTDKKMHGYAGGIELKKELLRLESKK